MISLQGMTIVITRPSPHGERWCEKIREQGGHALHFPTVFIKPVDDFGDARKKIAALNEWDWIFFTSPQAVYHSVEIIREYWPHFPRHVKVAAVGESTAHVLQQEGLPVDAYPLTDWHSEGVLNLSEFQDVVNKKIGLIKGEGGRTLLNDTLNLRQAKVIPVVVYERKCPIISSREIGLLKHHNIDIIVATSGEILQNFIALTKGMHWETVPLVVISERMVAIAKELRFQHVLLAKNASLPAIMSILEETICQMKKKV